MPTLQPSVKAEDAGDEQQGDTGEGSEDSSDEPPETTPDNMYNVRAT